jgi:hypothetical protein
MLNEVELGERQRRALGVGTLTARSSSSAFASYLAPFGPSRYSRVRAPVAPYVLKQDALVRSGECTQPPLSSQIIPINQKLQDQVSASWLFEALLEIEQLPKLAKEMGVPIPSAILLRRVTAIARLCDEFGLTEPVFDLREKGDVEIFCREEKKGLLIVVRDDLLQVFGDYSGEMWRARYDFSGSTWESHLRKFVQDLIVR